MNETIFSEILEALKQRDALVKVLQESVVLQQRELEALTARVSANEDHYLKLVRIIEKSVLKIDVGPSGLGVN